MDEYRVHMSLWSHARGAAARGQRSARHAAPTSPRFLMNKEVIAVDQDPLGKQGVRVAKNGDLEVWSRPLEGGAMAVGLFNRGTDRAKVTAKWSDLGISGSKNVRDLWAHADRGKALGEYSADVVSHGVVMIELK